MPTAADILDAAEAIHQREGLAALSLRRVADAVGVTPMALYRHYADKDALLDALVARGFSILEGYFAAAAAKRSPRARIGAGVTQYREFALDHPRLFELMYFVRRRGVPTAPDSLRVTPSPSFARLIESVNECMERGEIRRGDAGETILLVWATAHGLIALHFTGRFGGDDERFRALFDKVVTEQIRLLAP